MLRMLHQTGAVLDLEAQSMSFMSQNARHDSSSLANLTNALSSVCSEVCLTCNRFSLFKNVLSIVSNKIHGSTWKENFLQVMFDNELHSQSRRDTPLHACVRE